MQVELTEVQVRALKALGEGLEHHDSFGAQPDESPIFIDGTDENLYELPTGDRQLNLGDLRTLLTIYRG